MTHGVQDQFNDILFLLEETSITVTTTISLQLYQKKVFIFP